MSKPDFNTYGKTMAKLRAERLSADIDKHKEALRFAIARLRDHAEHDAADGIEELIR